MSRDRKNIFPMVRVSKTFHPLEPILIFMF